MISVRTKGHEVAGRKHFALNKQTAIAVFRDVCNCKMDEKLKAFTPRNHTRVGQNIEKAFNFDTVQSIWPLLNFKKGIAQCL